MAKRTVTVRQIQKLDKIAIQKYGVPSLCLMESAGHGVTREAIKALRANPKPRALEKARVQGRENPKVCVVCGLGNNAGDGFVVARHLINQGVRVKVFLIGKGAKLKSDAAVNYKILKRLKYPIVEFQKVDKKVLSAIRGADIVVDAIFGVGLNREVLDPFKSVIEAINTHAKYIISIDTPSGLDGTTGKIYGVCVKAKKTVTFSFAKKGFFKNQGPQHTGKIIVVNIGIPHKLYGRL